MSKVLSITKGTGTGGSSTWGSITGTLSSQTDLQSALNAKVAKAGDTMTGTLTAPSVVGLGNSTTNYIAVTAKNTNTTGATVIDIDRAAVQRLAAIEYSTAGTANWYAGLLYNGGAAATSYGISADSTQANAKLLLDTTGTLTSIGSTTTGSIPTTSAGGAAGVGTYGLTSTQYLASRGPGLVTNGSGLLGNNYNFTSGLFTYNATDHPVGALASMYTNVGFPGAAMFDENIPVDPYKYYELSFAYRQVAGTGNFYSFIAPYDADGLTISPYNYMAQANTLTTLAADLNPGDTTVTLTDATNWNNAAGTLTYLRAIIFWDYTDGKGYTWPANTYSRNYSGVNFYANGGITGNVITLNVPYAGIAHPAGTQVSNSASGGSFMYIGAMSAVGQSTWTNYSGRFGGGVHPGGSSASATTKLPYGTASVKAGILKNYPSTGGDPTSQQAVANFNITNVPLTDFSSLAMDGVNIPLGTSIGTQIGTATTQKLGFYGATAIVKPTGNIATALTNLGLVATPTLSDSSNYITSLYASRLNVSSTTYIDGNLIARAISVVGTSGTSAVYILSSASTFAAEVCMGYGSIRKWHMGYQSSGSFAFVESNVSIRLSIAPGGDTSLQGNFYPTTNATYSLGSSGYYWSNLYASRLNLNSTAYLDGGTAGVINGSGDFALPTAGDFIGLQTSAPTHSLTVGSTATGIALYNTTDQTTNYERVRQYWSGNVFNVGTESGGTGSIRVLNIGALTGGITTQYGVGIPRILNTASTSSSTTGPFISNTMASTASSGSVAMYSITPTINQSSTAGYTALLINPTETATGSGAKNLIDAQVGSVSKFKVDNTGKITVPVGGAAAVAGTAVLLAGTVTVSTTAITASSIVILTCQVLGTVTVASALTKGTVVAGTSFVINSAVVTDTSTIAWLIIN